MSASGKMQELRASSSRAVTTPRPKGMDEEREKLPEGERNVVFLERSSDLRSTERVNPNRGTEHYTYLDLTFLLPSDLLPEFFPV